VSGTGTCRAGSLRAASPPNPRARLCSTSRWSTRVRWLEGVSANSASSRFSWIVVSLTFAALHGKGCVVPFLRRSASAIETYVPAAVSSSRTSMPRSLATPLARLPLRQQTPRLRGFTGADEGTRPLDLLHGKCEQPFAPVRSNPVCAGLFPCKASERERTRANAEPCQPLPRRQAPDPDAARFCDPLTCLLGRVEVVRADAPDRSFILSLLGSLSSKLARCT
jgi:hypothetical protein